MHKKFDKAVRKTKQSMLKSVPVTIDCPKCHHTFTAVQGNNICPKCESSIRIETAVRE